MTETEWENIRLDIRILLSSIGLYEDAVRRSEAMQQILEEAITYQEGFLSRRDRTHISELLPQTGKLWPESRDAYEFIKNIQAEARGTEKIIKIAKGYTTDPAFILGSKVAETESMIYKTYDAVALWFVFAIGIGVGVILATVFWHFGW